MSLNVTKWRKMSPKNKLSIKQEKAAADVVEDVLTVEEIARLHNIHKRTLFRWKNEPLFRARVDELTEAIKERLYAKVIADCD